MKLIDYQLKDWINFKISKSIKFGCLTILLLEIDRTIMPPPEGRKNLIAIDADDNLLWIADFPKGNTLYGSFDEVDKVSNLLTAWCGSIFCEINPQTGKILQEKFIKQ